MLLFISWLLVWNPLGSNPEHIKAHGIRPESQECDALRREDLQRSLMEIGIQLSWNLWFGASAKAGQQCFAWRMLICEDQSITQGQFGFNQRLMKNGRVLKVLSVSVSLSAKHLCCLPSELMVNRKLRAAPQLPHLLQHVWWAAGETAPALGCRAAFLVRRCGTGILAFQFAAPQQSAAQLHSCVSSSKCRTARASVLDWPFAESAKTLGLLMVWTKTKFWNFKTLPSAKHNLLSLLCYS